MPTWAMWSLVQSVPWAQKIRSPGSAWARGRCLPREEWYWVWAVRGMTVFLDVAWQMAYWVRPGEGVSFEGHAYVSRRVEDGWRYRNSRSRRPWLDRRSRLVPSRKGDLSLSMRPGRLPHRYLWELLEARAGGSC